MRDSSYIRQFPLSTTYFTVKSDGTGVNQTPFFARWYAGLGMDADVGVVYIDNGNPANGFVTKAGFSSAAVVQVPMDYISRLQSSSGVMIMAVATTGAYTTPTLAANQNGFAFKNGILQGSYPATIPSSATDTWVLVITNDKLA